MTKSTLFKNAWTFAKQGAKKFGGSAKEYFAEALKKAWAFLKEFNTPGFSTGLEIKQWFVNKNFTQQEKMVINSSDREVVKETEKAVQILFSSKYGNLTKWVPKSCLVA